jgi:hypothetical protein
MQLLDFEGSCGRAYRNARQKALKSIPRTVCGKLHSWAGSSSDKVSFRDAALVAHRGRCAISHIPEPRLLDAAHIVMDADEQFGQPIV